MGSSIALPELDAHFPRYTGFDPIVPVWCVTPDSRGMMQKYYDTCPFSPSGRQMILLDYPFEDHLPEPGGEAANLVLLDLETGEQKVVATTDGWDTQTGAHQQWGADDSTIFYNDLDTTEWRPYGVKLDLQTGEKQTLEGTIYMVSPDAKWSASPSLLRAPITQPGYGVVVPEAQVPTNHGASDKDGVWITNLESGSCELFLSIKDIVQAISTEIDVDEYAEGDFYGAHVKWNSKSDRLLFVLRWIPWDSDQDPTSVTTFAKVNLVTFKRDGSDIHVAIPNAEWGVKGGHHPIWHPDGEHVMINLKLDGETMRFVTARYDGADLRSLSDEVHGSGHPSMHPDGRHIVTDGQAGDEEPLTDGTNVIRLVDIEEGTEQSIIRILNTPPFLGKRREFRVDLHPTWGRAYKRIAFNACPDGTRRVYVADLASKL